MMNKIIVAHRGGKEYEHENTLEAFEKAMDLGVKMAELDIQQTNDNKVVCYHDSEIQGKKVKDITYEELKRLSGVKVPLFKDVLKLLKGQMKLLCELKQKNIEKEALRLLKKYFYIEDVIVISFHDRSIFKIKKLDKNVKTGLIMGKKKLSVYLKDIFAIIRAKRCKADALIINFNFIKLGFAFIANLLKIQVYTWTINEPELIVKYINDQNVYGIITDKPEKALKLLTACSNGK